LRANRSQPCAIDSVGEPFFRLDESLGSQFFKHRHRAVSEDMTFSRKAFDGNDFAGSVAMMNDATPFGEDVQRPLFRFGDIHAGNPFQ